MWMPSCREAAFSRGSTSSTLWFRSTQYRQLPRGNQEWDYFLGEKFQHDVFFNSPLVHLEWDSIYRRMIEVKIFEEHTIEPPLPSVTVGFASWLLPYQCSLSSWGGKLPILRSPDLQIMSKGSLTVATPWNEQNGDPAACEWEDQKH